MTLERRLRSALIIVGIVFVVGVYPLINLWPAGFRWQPQQHEYEQMTAAIMALASSGWNSPFRTLCHGSAR